MWQVSTINSNCVIYLHFICTCKLIVDPSLQPWQSVSYETVCILQSVHQINLLRVSLDKSHYLASYCPLQIVQILAINVFSFCRVLITFKMTCCEYINLTELEVWKWLLFNLEIKTQVLGRLFLVYLLVFNEAFWDINIV